MIDGPPPNHSPELLIDDVPKNVEDKFKEMPSQLARQDKADAMEFIKEKYHLIYKKHSICTCLQIHILFHC